MDIINRSFTRLDESQLAALIQTAQVRLAYLAPGVNETIASLLLDRWTVLGPQAVKIVLDLDPEVLRIGYGTLDGLQLLQAGAEQLGVQLTYQPGLRIGLLIIDQIAVAYTPIPQMIEAGSIQGFQPNAIFLDTIPQGVLDELGWGNLRTTYTFIGQETILTAQVKAIAANIRDNPPQRFDIAHKIHVFNSRFEFVETEMKGTAIERIEVKLPTELLGLAQSHQVRTHLHTRYRLLDNRSEVSSNSIRNARRRLVDRYLITLPGYGQVVLRQDKEALLAGIECLRKEIDIFSIKISNQLQNEIDKNREALYEALAPVVIREPPDTWLNQPTLFEKEVLILEKLRNTLKSIFGTADRWIQRMSLSVNFKGVTYEMLTDPQFTAIAEKAIPGILHDEYDAAPRIPHVQN